MAAEAVAVVAGGGGGSSGGSSMGGGSGGGAGGGGGITCNKGWVYSTKKQVCVRSSMPRRQGAL